VAFGIDRVELQRWKEQVLNGEIAFLTHYWQDPRFPHATTVTKVGCISIPKLVEWGNIYGLKERWIHQNDYPHFDLFGQKQKEVLIKEKLFTHIERFSIT